jgi:hypothetical protein
MLKNTMSKINLIMNIKIMLAAAFTLSLLFTQSGTVMAGNSTETSTPYGDYCRKYSHYGKNRIVHDYKHAEKALIHYYDKKGLEVKPLNRRGRFIKVNIIKDDKIVDIILFDRYTGRIRSIY